MIVTISNDYLLIGFPLVFSKNPNTLEISMFDVSMYKPLRTPYNEVRVITIYSLYSDFIYSIFILGFSRLVI